MGEYCPEHNELITNVAEIKNDVKWLVDSQKKVNGVMAQHIVESNQYRPKIDKNAGFRYAFIWAFVIYGGLIILIFRLLMGGK